MNIDWKDITERQLLRSTKKIIQTRFAVIQNSACMYNVKKMNQSHYAYRQFTMARLCGFYWRFQCDVIDRSCQKTEY